jgi:hypothetical protein
MSNDSGKPSRSWGINQAEASPTKSRAEPKVPSCRVEWQVEWQISRCFKKNVVKEFQELKQIK